MLVTQCPRCHESVCVPDALLSGGQTSDSSARAQCPWCLETLDSSELRATLPPALMLVGEQAVLSSGDAPPDEWAGIERAAASHRTSHDASSFPAEGQFRDIDRQRQDHGPPTQPLEGEASELDSSEIAFADEQDDNELAFQRPVSPQPATRSGAPASPPERVIKIRVPGKSGAGGDRSGAMMDVDASHGRRRSKRSSPLKTLIGVALGGLLALPIVGIILHYATGQYVPYVSDILPGGGSPLAKIRTNSPMPVDHSQPIVSDQPTPNPLPEPSVGEEMTTGAAPDEQPDPAQSALQAITGDATRPNTVSDPQDSYPLTSDAPENLGTLPGSTAPDAEMPAANTPDTAAPQTEPPSANMADNTLPDSTLMDSALMDSAQPDSNLFDDTQLDDALFDDTPLDDTQLDDALPGDDVSDGDVLDQFDLDSMQPDRAAAITEADPANPLDVATGNTNTGNTNTFDATPTAPEPMSPADPATRPDTDDLFDGASDPAAPAPFSPALLTPSVDVEAEIAQLIGSIDQINALPSDAPQRVELTQQLYESLSKLAGEVPANSMEKLSPVLDEIASNTNLVIAFARATPDWVSRPAADRGGNGAVVVGRMSGDAAEATFTLLNRQELPVTMPPSVTSVPTGFQIGVGQITGDGADAVLTLDLLQSINQ